VASVSSAHEWRPKAGSQTSSATFRPWAIKVLPQRLRHLGSEATALACHAAGPKGPTIPDDGFGGASNAFHTRRVTRRHGRATRTTAWAPRPERDKHYLLVHVILTGLTGCAHPERVRGVTCDQPGPRIPQNISLTSAARANDASQKVEWWFDTCCPNFGSRKGNLDRENRDEDMLHIILSHIVELILLSFQSIPIFSLPAFGAGACFERN
jgi:hypothetical protein